MERYGAKDLALYKRVLIMGPKISSDTTLLAVILTGSTTRPALDVAHDLLKACGGNITILSHRHVTEVVPGIGDAGYARILAAAEMFRRASIRSCSVEASVVRESSDAHRALKALGQEEVENLAALYLDRRNRVVGMRILSTGNMAHTIVDPQEVLRPALELRANAVILAHNHPSGDPSPSRADIEVTTRVTEASRILGIELLDHLVVARDRYTSMREQDLMPAAGRLPTAIAQEYR